MEFRERFGRDEPGPVPFDSTAAGVAPGGVSRLRSSRRSCLASGAQPGSAVDAPLGAPPAGEFSSPREREAASAPPPTRSVILGVAFIAGFQHHHGMHPRVLWSLHAGDPLHLVREPGNPYDRFATALYTAAGARLGYVPRGLNEPVANLIDQDVEVLAAVGEVDPAAEPWKRVRIAIWVEIPVPMFNSEN